MINPNLILSECYVDTLLMNMVLKDMHEDEWANHHHGISVVASAMLTRFKNKKAVGLVDDDRVQPEYFKDFQQLDEAGFTFKKTYYQRTLLNRYFSCF